MRRETLKRIPYLRSIIHAVKSGPRRVFDDLLWITSQHLKKQRLKLSSKSRLDYLRFELERAKYSRNCIVTITFGSFHLGNRDPLLHQLFESFVTYTRDPTAFEFLIKLDENDDYLYYYKVMKKFENNVNMRFFISPRGNGYADMHLWHAGLIKHRSKTSKALYILTEDAEFHYHDWDDELLALVRGREDTYFIATPCTLQDAIKVMGPNPEKPVPVYWVRGDDFPILGIDLINAIDTYVKPHFGWTSLGNLFNVDGFSGDILRIAWKDYSENIHVLVSLFAHRKGVFDWNENPVRGNLRNRTLLEFFHRENVEIRHGIVGYILECRGKRTSSVDHT